MLRDRRKFAYQFAVHKEKARTVKKDRSSQHGNTCISEGSYDLKTHLQHLSREIAFTRHLRRTYGAAVPASADMRHYYMGLDVQSCVKMCYKGHFTPYYLLIDPESGSVVPIEACRHVAPAVPMSNEAIETINLLEC